MFQLSAVSPGGPRLGTLRQYEKDESYLPNILTYRVRKLKTFVLTLSILAMIFAHNDALDIEQIFKQVEISFAISLK